MTAAAQPAKVATHAAHHINAPDDKDGDAGEMIGTKGEANEPALRDMASLTPLPTPQQSVLRRLIQGDSNKSIARKLAISEATAKVHVKSILRKIQVHNRTQAAIWAISAAPLMSAKDDISPEQITEAAAAPRPETRLFRPAGELRARRFPARQGHRRRLRELASLLLKGLAGRKLSFQKAAAAAETSNRSCRVGFQPIPRLGAYASISGPRRPRSALSEKSSAS
jgi:DNA-binding CsgD family transcriptional regulator